MVKDTRKSNRLRKSKYPKKYKRKINKNSLFGGSADDDEFEDARGDFPGADTRQLRKHIADATTDIQNLERQIQAWKRAIEVEEDRAKRAERERLLVNEMNLELIRLSEIIHDETGYDFRKCYDGNWDNTSGNCMEVMNTNLTAQFKDADSRVSRRSANYLSKWRNEIRPALGRFTKVYTFLKDEPIEIGRAHV